MHVSFVYSFFQLLTHKIFIFTKMDFGVYMLRDG